MTSNTLIQKIMSATPSEFYRSLRALAPGVAIADGQSEFTLAAPGGPAKISYRVLPPRQVTGVLSLPQLEVLIDLGAVDEAGRQAFMHGFDLAFRRGGG